MDALKEQTRMWSYFQSRPELFQRSGPRYLALMLQIERRDMGRKVLNIGAGDGMFERLVTARGWDIESVDPDATIVSTLQKEGIKATVGAVEKLPHADGSFNFVVASEVIEHLSNDQLPQAISEVARALSPGGFFIGTVPYAENLSDAMTLCPSCGHEFHRWGHHQSFSLERIRSLLLEHFEIKKLTRTVFVQRSAKGLVRLMLAKLGSPIAIPSILWVAQKA